MVTSIARAPVHARPSLVRSLCVGLGLAVTLATSSRAQAQPPELDHAGDTSAELDRPRWVSSWSAAPMADGTTLTGPSRSFDDQSVRQVVQLSVGGTRVRVQLSNLFGSAPLVIGAAHVARSAGGDTVAPDSDRVLTFDGDTTVSIPPGETRLSDPAVLRVGALSTLSISLYLPEQTGPATFHAFGNQTAFISASGDDSDSIDFPTAESSTSRFYLTHVEVLPARRSNALVALGDSITDGGESTLDANRRWTDFLARRLAEQPASRVPPVAVLNQGIGCGRLLRDFCGPSGASRFERDVLDVTGVTHVVLALGFVDIFFPTAANNPAELVTAEEIIAGLRALAQQAHRQGLQVFAATHTPYEGTTFANVFTPENEAKRQAVNHWIRTTRALDGVFDFDAAVRDPARPTQLLARFASADRLHLSDAGYAALAASIDLSLLR